MAKANVYLKMKYLKPVALKNIKLDWSASRNANGTFFQYSIFGSFTSVSDKIENSKKIAHRTTSVTIHCTRLRLFSVVHIRILMLALLFTVSHWLNILLLDVMQHSELCIYHGNWRKINKLSLFFTLLMQLLETSVFVLESTVFNTKI